MIILPVLTFMCLVLILIRKECNVRHQVITASILWGCIVTWITEILSLLGEFSYVWLIISYSVILAFLLFINIRYQEKNLIISIKSSVEKVKFSPFLMILISSVGFILITVLIVALTAPPNNWDSMTYHMARAVHWIQNRSVAHYPTHRLMQLSQPPWAEYVITHFQILSGSDRFANIVQWSAMAGCVIGVSLISKVFGASSRGQIFSSVVAVTIPMGILQGSSTQNDYVLSYWLVVTIYFLLVIVKEGPKTDNVLSFAGSLGLAALTKSTSYLFAFPFIIWLAVWGMIKMRQKAWIYAFLIASIFIIVNVGHYSRNAELFGKIIYAAELHTNETTSPGVFVSNVVRNAGIEMGNPFPFLCDKMENAISLIHRFIGVDINDYRTTWKRQTFSIPSSKQSLFHEDTAPNPLHFLFSIIALGAVFSLKRVRKDRVLLIYCVCIIAAFCMFCFILKWQPWHNRLHLPLFILFSPVVGVLLSRISPSIMGDISVVTLVVISITFILFNVSRPLIGGKNIFNTERIEQYFNNRPALKEPYDGVITFLLSRGCNMIGLYLLPIRGDYWEYPLWVLMKNKGANDFRIEHYGVENISAKKYECPPYEYFNPCAIIAINDKSLRKEGEELVIEGRTFNKVWNSEPVTAFALRTD